MNALIDLNGIGKTYDGVNCVLNELSFSLREGETAVIFGKSGCGKSTLLNIIGLLDTRSCGDYLFRGRPISKKHLNSYNRIRADEIGFVFQSYCLIDALSVRDNILMPFLYNGKKLDREVYSSLDETASELGLSDLLDRKASLLSGGEKQRAAIARAMIKKPALLIADEPTGNLDEGNTRLVTEAFRRIAGNGAALIVVTHNRGLELGEGSRYELSEGRLLKCV